MNAGGGSHCQARREPVARQNCVRAEITAIPAQGQDSPQLDAPPPLGPPTDAPLSHSFSTRSHGREPGPSATACHPGLAPAPGHPARQPALLGPAAPLLEQVGRGPRHRRAGYGRALALLRVSHLLELAVQAGHALRPPSPAGRGPGSHQEDGYRQLLGRAPHPGGTALPWLRGLRARRPALPSQPASRPEGWPDLDDVPPEPPGGHRLHGLLLGAHGFVPRPPRALRHPPRPARRGPRRRHDETDRGVGRPAASRGLPLRIGAALHELRPRRHLLGGG